MSDRHLHAGLLYENRLGLPATACPGELRRIGRFIEQVLDDHQTGAPGSRRMRDSEVLIYRCGACGHILATADGEVRSDYPAKPRTPYYRQTPTEDADDDHAHALADAAPRGG